MFSIPSFQDSAIAGASAGAVARFLTAPFDMLKIRFQVQSNSQGGIKYTSLLQAFRTIVREEGVPALWKGNLSATYLWVSYSMVQFSVYGTLKRELILYQSRNGEKPSETLGNVALFAAGSTAGILATIATYPFDIMRTQFAIQGRQRVVTSIGHYLSSTLKSPSGAKGFYRGIVPAVIGVAPYMGLNFALYESIQRMLKSHTVRNSSGRRVETRFETGLETEESTNMSQSMSQTMWNTLRTALAGGAAGVVSKLTLYPLDTVKKRTQVQYLHNTAFGIPATGSRRYKNILDCIKIILKEEGLKGFYRGLLPTLLKSFCSTGITFATYELVLNMLQLKRLQR